MTKTFVVEKTFQLIVTEDDLLLDEPELTESVALAISREIPYSDWVVVNEAVEVTT